MSRVLRLAIATAVLGALVPTDVLAQSAPPWVIERYDPPPGAVLEVGGLDWMSDGRLVLSTRRGQVWHVENPLARDIRDARFSLYAEGLDEGLGLAVKRGASMDTPGGDEIFVMQRGELSRLSGLAESGRCDQLTTICNAWGLSGNYHEFGFGLPVDADGNFYVSFNVSFGSPEWWLGASTVPYRGWVARISPDGEFTPLATGFRSPAGLGFDAHGRLLVTDNQGDWMPACPIVEVTEGSFFSHPAGLDWTADYQRHGMKVSRELPPEGVTRTPAAVWLPYKWSRSAGNLVADTTGGAFGPFAGQLFVAELTNGLLLRVSLEEVEGELQGVCWPFLEKVGSAFRLSFAPDGSLIAGLTNRGWGGLPPPDGLVRIRWNGTVPFEMQDVKVLSDGFRITFTQPLAPDCAPGPEDILLTQYDYDWWWEYGSPERRTVQRQVTSVTVADDRLALELHAPDLVPGMVARAVLSNIVSASGAPLAHPEFAYTVNRLPGKPPPAEQVVKLAPPPPPRVSGDEGWLRLTYGDAFDGWRSSGWQLVNAQLDPDDASRLYVSEGVDALVNAADGSSSDYVSRWDLGDGRYHVEFMLPEGGESAVYVAGRYGLRLGSSKESCGALLLPDGGERAPALPVWTGAGQWLELDLRYEPPRFDAQGRKTANARLHRVMVDDILMHDEIEFHGPSAGAPLFGQPEAEAGPLVLTGARGLVALRTLRFKPDPAAQGPAAGERWVSLFNGVDIEGWSVRAEDPSKGGWAVEDGILTGTGPRSHLFSPRGDYRDIALRCELRISDGGNSGMYVRAALGEGWPAGYEAQVNSSFSDPVKTGSLYGLSPVKVSLVGFDTWFTQEIRVRDVPEGTHLQVFVNGVLVSDVIDPERRHSHGHIALQQHHDGSVVEFRKIEVREL